VRRLKKPLNKFADTKKSYIFVTTLTNLKTMATKKKYLSKISQKGLNKLVTKKETDFKNAKGVNKQKARELMVKAVRTVGTILTLPFEEAIIEKMILKIHKKMDFLAYECEREVFWNLYKTIGTQKLPMTAIFGKIGKAIFSAEENQYSNLILDYCGVLDTFAKEIEYAIKNNIVQKNGIIAVTLSKIGLQNENGIIGEIFRKTPYEFYNTTLSQTELGVKLFFNNIMSKEYEMETVFNYSDKKDNGNNGMAMILVIIRRKS
jgi:hypothetical protein